MMTQFTDDLVVRLQAGDDAAFAELVHEHSGRVYGIAKSMLRHEQDARDVVQETFLNAFRRIHTFRGDAPLGSWISRIARNNALMKLRTRRRKPETSIEIAGPRFDDDGRHALDIVDWAPASEELAMSRELGERIRDAVDALPDKYRTVLMMADYQELSMKHIAEELGLTIPNVKTRLHRARLAVRASMTAYLAGDD